MNEYEEPFISIIIVAHNDQRYVGTCLRSIISQCLHNIEIIVINNASKDSTKEILSNIAENDNRVTIINNEEYIEKHESIKIALKIAKGLYVHMVNPSDYLVPYAYKELYEYSLINKLDVVLFASFIVKNNKTKVKNISNKLRSYKKRILSSHIDKQFFLKSDPLVTTWNILFKKDFLIESDILSKESIMFPKIRLMWNILIFANRISFLNIPVYYYNKKIKDLDKKIVPNLGIISTMEQIFNCLKKNDLLKIYAIPFSKAVLKNYVGYFNKTSKKRKKSYLEEVKKSLNYMELCTLLKQSTLKRKINIVQKTKFPLLSILVKTKIIT